MWEKELKAMLEAGMLAREKILEIYKLDFEVEIKEDASPVTMADKAADLMISSYLRERFPTYAFLTEESEDTKERLNNDFVFIVDPVDGTKDFVAKNDEFATNIALSYKHEVVVGVIVIPATNHIYYAVKGEGAYHRYPDGRIERIHVNDKVDDLTLFTSRFHSTDFEKNLPLLDPRIKHVQTRGSSIKACHIAEGLGELHYRTSPGTKEWDIAPLDLLIHEAGGVFIKPDGTRYTYNRVDVYNREGYIAANRLDNIKVKA